MKKVLFVHNAIPEYRLEFWRMLGEDYDVRIYALDKDLADKIYKLEKNIGALKIYYAKNTLIETVLEEKYDIVVMPAVDTLENFFVTKKIIKLKKNFDYKTVYWSEKWEASWSEQPISKRVKNLIHRKLILYPAIKSDICIASGTKSSEYLQMIGVKKEKIKIAIDSSTSPKAAPLINIRKQFGITDEKIILYMGRLVSRKGCADLIDAFKKTVKYKKCILLIAGDGPEYSLCKEKADGEYKIMFAGLVQPNERRAYYSEADVFVLPSRCENGVIEAWGLSVNEALECGTPVVVSDVVGATYDIVSEYNGKIFKNGDLNELGNSIDCVLNGNYDRTEIINKYNIYSVKMMAKAFGKVFEECI